MAIVFMQAGALYRTAEVGKQGIPCDGKGDDHHNRDQLRCARHGTESYNSGHNAAVSELGAPSDEARRLMDGQLPQAQAIDCLAQETVDVPTSTHCGSLRAIVDGFRAVVSEVTATVALDTGFWFLWIRAESRIGTWMARLQGARPPKPGRSSGAGAPSTSGLI
ncbi:hypothetical protein [Streptomyces erythrochromogenes]|uniref:hypothetical protein n=1 Tax=Streptomyces erythrochromogenes TaxID=285574 RepID=UPI0033F43E7A